MAEYQGWTNYETWAVNLWLENDEGSYRYWGSQAQGAYAQAQGTEYSTRAEIASYRLADQLEADHEEALPELDGFAGDLLTAALSEVNWREIAAALIETLIENGDPDDESADEDEATGQ